MLRLSIKYLSIILSLSILITLTPNVAFSEGYQKNEYLFPLQWAYEAQKNGEIINLLELSDLDKDGKDELLIVTKTDEYAGIIRVQYYDNSEQPILNEYYLDHIYENVTYMYLDGTTLHFLFDRTYHDRCREYSCAQSIQYESEHIELDIRAESYGDSIVYLQHNYNELYSKLFIPDEYFPYEIYVDQELSNKYWNGKDMTFSYDKYFVNEENVDKVSFENSKTALFGKYNWIKLERTPLPAKVFAKIAEKLITNFNGNNMNLPNILSKQNEKFLISLEENLAYSIGFESYSRLNPMSNLDLLSYVHTLGNSVGYSTFTFIDDKGKESIFRTGRIPIKQVNDFLNNYLGRQISLADNNEFLEYGYNITDKYFLYEDTFDSDFVSRPYIHSIYELEKDTYYIEYTEYDGKMSPFSLSIDLDDKNEKSSTSIRHFPLAVRALTPISGEYYVIMKKSIVNDEIRWMLLEKQPLSNEINTTIMNKLTKTELELEPLTLTTPLSKYKSVAELLDTYKLNESLNGTNQSALIKFIESGIQSLSQKIIPVTNNNVEIPLSSLAKQNENSHSIHATLNEEKSIQSISSDYKQFQLVNHVVLQDVIQGLPIQINLVNDDTVLLNGNLNDVYITNSEGNKGIYLSKDLLKSILTENKNIIITLDYSVSDQVIFNLLDERNKPISNLPGIARVIINNPYAYSTVFLNERVVASKAIVPTSIRVVPVKSTGTYVLTELSIDTLPFKELSQEEQQIIISSILSNLITIETSDDISKTVSRYDFAKALVNLFIVYDENSTTSFTDVPLNNEYYQYVASGEQSGVIWGFKDGTYGGHLPITRLQMLSLVGRTLSNSEFFHYPSNISSYTSFLDIDLVSEEDIKDVAISVFYGLLPQGGLLEPNREITKIEAAEILTALYELLYPSNPHEEIVNEQVLEMYHKEILNNKNKTSFLLWTLLSLVLIAIIGLCIFALWRKKKRAIVTSSDS